MSEDHKGGDVATTCVICFDDIKPGKPRWKCPSCTQPEVHMCRSCAVTWAKDMITEAKGNTRCPGEGCTVIVDLVDAGFITIRCRAQWEAKGIVNSNQQLIVMAERYIRENKVSRFCVGPEDIQDRVRQLQAIRAQMESLLGEITDLSCMKYVSSSTATDELSYQNSVLYRARARVIKDIQKLCSVEPKTLMARCKLQWETVDGIPDDVIIEKIRAMRRSFMVREEQKITENDVDNDNKEEPVLEVLDDDETGTGKSSWTITDISGKNLCPRCLAGPCGPVAGVGRGQSTRTRYMCLNCKQQSCMACLEGTTPKSVHECKPQNLEMRERYKRCPKCGSWVEKAFGCDAMFCPAPLGADEAGNMRYCRTFFNYLDETIRLHVMHNAELVEFERQFGSIGDNFTGSKLSDRTYRHTNAMCNDEIIQHVWNSPEMRQRKAAVELLVERALRERDGNTPRMRFRRNFRGYTDWVLSDHLIDTLNNLEDRLAQSLNGCTRTLDLNEFIIRDVKTKDRSTTLVSRVENAVSRLIIRHDGLLSCLLQASRLRDRALMLILNFGQSPLTVDGPEKFVKDLVSLLQDFDTFCYATMGASASTASTVECLSSVLPEEQWFVQLAEHWNMMNPTHREIVIGNTKHNSTFGKLPQTRTAKSNDDEMSVETEITKPVGQPKKRTRTSSSSSPTILDL